MPAATGQAQAPPATEITLAPGETMQVVVKPRVLQTVHLASHPGRYTEFRMELPGAGVRGRFIRLQPEPATGPNAAEPAISDSGLDYVRLPLAENAAATTLHVTVLTNSKADDQAVETVLSLVESEPTEAKRENAKALGAFNHAERLRRSHIGSDDALKAYNEALQDARLSHDAMLEQQVLLSAGRMLMIDGKHYAEAVDWERRAVAVQGSDAAPGVQALAWKMLGGALLDRDEYAESLEASRKALALYKQIGETFWEGVTLENMGEALMSLGDLPEALRTNEEALELSRRLHDDYGVVEMLAEIGSIHRTRGEYQQALNDFAEAVEVSLPSSYNPMQGEAWLAMGELHREMAEPAQAAADYQHALTIAQQTVSGLDELEARRDIAELEFDSGKVTQAQADFNSALARARELKLVRPRSALLIGLAKAALRAAHTDEARRLLEQAIELAESIHQQVQTAEAYETLGGLEESAGDLKAAAADTLEAQQLFTAVPDRAGAAQADVELARIEKRAGDTDAALGHLGKAMDIVESSRTSFSRGALRTRFFAAQRAAYETAVALLMERDRREPGHGFAEQAWQVAERARARSLLDELGSLDRSSSGGPAENAAQQKQLAALEVRIGTLEEKRAQVGTDTAQLAAAAHIESQLRETILAADELASRLRHSEQADAWPVDRITSAEFATAALGRHDALLEYWPGSDASYVWMVLQDGSCTGYSLAGQKALLQEIALYRAALLARTDLPAGESLEERELRLVGMDAKAGTLSKKLAAELLPAAMREKLADVQRLVLVADGTLSQMPFAGLEFASGAAGHEASPKAAARGTHYLIERFELVSEPSAAYLMIAPKKDAAKTPMRVAVFADPVYNSADSRLASTQAHTTLASMTHPNEAVGTSSALGHVPRLTGSRQEALAIASIAGPARSSQFLGLQVNASVVRGLDWLKYPVAHFAVHAISQKASPDSAGMLLSLFDAQGRPQNGILWVRQVEEKPMARELVVLSGCGTALGEPIPGEGMNSLARGFLLAGTRQVAATLWSADDASSGILMKTFYEGLMQRGMGAAEALRQAQLSMLRQPQFAAPLYWAGFVVEGQWKTR